MCLKSGVRKKFVKFSKSVVKLCRVVYSVVKRFVKLL